MGLRLSNTTDVTFENVRVKASAMLGEEGSGFKLALNALNLSRAFVATMAVGIMQRALDESVKYAKERKQFGQPLISFQMVQQLLADMAIKIEASRCLVNNTMRMMDNGSLVRKEGSITKPLYRTVPRRLPPMPSRSSADTVTARSIRLRS